MRKIKITEEQVKALAKMVNEIALDGDEALANSDGNMQQAARDVVAKAKEGGLRTDDNTSVTFGADALRKNVGISEEKIVGKVTKAQIKECRLATLKGNAVKTVKKGEF